MGNPEIPPTLAEAGRRFRDGSLTPAALTDLCLGRIAIENPRLNAFYEVFADAARADARAATEDLAAGRDRGPLHGIPVGIKDLFDVCGSVTTGGASKAFHPSPAGADADAVAALRKAGAVLLGKTGLHEWAFGVSNNNPHFGPTRNPHDPARVPGGSSGGSAAALAAGLCLGALGTDTGGSIRIPASLCGVTGLKPTFGRVSTRGLLPLAPSLDTAGPMARSVRDVFALLDVLTGEATPDAPLPRVRVPAGDFFAPEDPAIDGIVAGRRAPLGGAEPVDLGDLDAVWKANTTLLLSEAAATHAARLEADPSAFGTGLPDRFRAGKAIRPEQVAEAKALQAEWRSRLASILGDDAVLALPATACTATPIGNPEGQDLSRRLTRTTAPFNLPGVPCLVLPAGTVGGLPVGLQLVAAPGQERLLRAAGLLLDPA